MAYPTRTLTCTLLAALLTAASCAQTDALRDDEMDQLLNKAWDEYADIAEFLEHIAEDEEIDEDVFLRLEVRTKELLKELPELAIPLETYRSRLSDQHSNIRNEIPERYLALEGSMNRKDQRDRNRGFRIQIISTPDARFADEIQEDFEEWIRSVSSPPLPRTYMVFEQPYYRVRIGDFRDRQKALEFTDFVRLRYPEAWVVHSRIHPGRVER